VDDATERELIEENGEWIGRKGAEND